MTCTQTLTPALDEDAASPVLFADLALPDRLLSALADDGYTEPSPIQAAIIPFLLDGRDVIGQAQTGTGKTAAFALPILTQLAEAAANLEAGEKRPKGPTSLILAPTRELAIQVADAFAKYARKMSKVKVLAVYGGADFRGQEIALHRGVDVVVGTPGRVIDHMRRGTMDVSNVRTLVLDEADEMLRMGFVDDVEWVLSETPAGRQVALFSATMPGAIRTIAERQLNNPERIKIAGESKAADTIRQRYWRVEGMGKVEALCRLLSIEPVDAALVFVRTRNASTELARRLNEEGYPAAPLSGEVSQSQRERTIDQLRQGKLKLVVATDVAARGIDVKSITHVFNFDAPEDTEAYIHRIGRTGRAGRTGEAVLFVENRQRYLLKNIERATGKDLEKMEMPSIEDIRALKLEEFGQQLTERLAFKGESPKPAALRDFIEKICEETGRDAVDVAAFLVGPAMKANLGVSLNENASPTSAPARPTSSAGDTAGRFQPDRGDRPQRSDRPSPGFQQQGRPDRYRVAVGMADGIQPGNLVGAIANEAGIEGKRIGGIRIYEHHSTVELPAGMPDDVFQLLQRTTVMGKPLRIRRDDGATASTHAPRHAPRTKVPFQHRKGGHPTAGSQGNHGTHDSGKPGHKSGPDSHKPGKTKGKFKFNPKAKVKTKGKTKVKAKFKLKSNKKNK